jgi:hypothetical protein
VGMMEEGFELVRVHFLSVLSLFSLDFGLTFCQLISDDFSLLSAVFQLEFSPI